MNPIIVKIPVFGLGLPKFGKYTVRFVNKNALIVYKYVNINGV